MKLTRRKALAGIGMGAIASGAVFGSGAFSRTEADRDFDLTIETDEDALLKLEPNDDEDFESGAVREEDGVLFFDFSEFSGETEGDGISSQGDTAFRRLFTVTNQASDDIWVWIPAGEDARDVNEEQDFWEGIYESGARSTEFVAVDDGQEFQGDGDLEANSSRVDPRGVDLSFPNGFHKNPDDEGDSPDSGDLSGVPAGEQSRAFGMTAGGAVKLEPSESVDVDVNFLVLGARDEADEFSAQTRFIADREAPDPGTPADATSDWFTTFFNV